MLQLLAEDSAPKPFKLYKHEFEVYPFHNDVHKIIYLYMKLKMENRLQECMLPKPALCIGDVQICFRSRYFTSCFLKCFLWVWLTYNNLMCKLIDKVLI